jgi:signal transduction histidine kinase
MPCIARVFGAAFVAGLSNQDLERLEPAIDNGGMPLQVLVADDIASSRGAACELVATLGHVPHPAASGAEALERVAAGDIDLVLLDLLMPGLDGFEVTRRLRAFEPTRWLPVIVTSGLQGEEHFLHALEEGADDCLARPLQSRLLGARLRHYERVLALQQGLAEAAARQQAILDNVVEPVLTMDDEGRIQDHNRAAANLCDSRGESIRSGLAQELLTGEPWPGVRERRQLVLQRLGGQRLVVEPGWSRWQGAGAAQHTVVLRDVSQQQQVQRMQEEFLATVSHELRTPLTSLLGAIGLLAGGAAGELPQRAQALAAMAQRNGQRLGRLIDDVLDLTKIEGDRLTLTLRPMNVVPLLHDAAAAIQAFARTREVQVLVGAGAVSAELRLDAERFQQVMSNLLSNAVKHSPAGGRVWVMLQADANAVRVTVRDEGRGVPEEFKARLFEKFAQADGSDRRAHEGTGLGLHIARLLVERMGGRIEVDAIEGPGASFSLVFPQAVPSDDQRPVLLLVDASASSPELLHELVGDLVRIDHCTALPTADVLSRAQLLLANPQAQGDADAFVAGLRRAAGARPILLWGDCVDTAYADRVALAWLPGQRANREALRTWLRERLRNR